MTDTELEIAAGIASLYMYWNIKHNIWNTYSLYRHQFHIFLHLKCPRYRIRVDSCALENITFNEQLRIVTFREFLHGLHVHQIYYDKQLNCKYTGLILARTYGKADGQDEAENSKVNDDWNLTWRKNCFVLNDHERVSAHRLEIIPVKHNQAIIEAGVTLEYCTSTSTLKNSIARTEFEKKKLKEMNTHKVEEEPFSYHDQ